MPFWRATRKAEKWGTDWVRLKADADCKATAWFVYDVAENNLAELYRTQGQYAAAEPLYKRALAMYEKALGPDHPNVATVLENMAVLYGKTGDKANETACQERAAKIRAQKRWGRFLAVRPAS